MEKKDTVQMEKDLDWVPTPEGEEGVLPTAEGVQQAPEAQAVPKVAAEPTELEK